MLRTCSSVSAARVEMLLSACATLSGGDGQFGGDHFELQADGGQRLADAGVQFAAQPLPFHLDLAYGFAPAAPAPPLRAWQTGAVPTSRDAGNED